jgi:hypothetical protein
MAATSRVTISIRSSGVNSGFFRRIGGNADDQVIDQLGPAPNDIGMAQRDRIERAGINTNSFGPTGNAGILSCLPFALRP